MPKVVILGSDTLAFSLTPPQHHYYYFPGAGKKNTDKYSYFQTSVNV